MRGRSHTKPTTRLLHKIPIRTFAEWQDAKVGEMGADLVGHDGGYGGGEHAFTLLLTDRVTQWTEPRAVLNKAQKWVFQELLQVRSWLPFVLVGLHTDCGGEFINHNLARYCGHEKIEFSRSRANRKNDNCFTEQKNNAVVREHAAICGWRPSGGRSVEPDLRSTAPAGEFLLPVPAADLQDPPGRSGQAPLRYAADPVSAGVGLPGGI